MEIVKDEPVSNVSEAKPSKYDPSKKYKWSPTDPFFLTGEEFGILLNATRRELASPEGQRILAIERAHFSLESSLARAVEQGVVKEQLEEKK